MWIGKGASASMYVGFAGANLPTPLQENTDTEYIITYENGTVSLTDGTDTISTSASLTKLYLIEGKSQGKLKNIRIYEL